MEIFNDIYSEATEISTIKTRKENKLWMTLEIYRLIKEQNRIWGQMKTNPENKGLKEKCKGLQNAITSLVRIEKRKFYLKKFQDCKDAVQC